MIPVANNEAEYNKRDCKRETIQYSHIINTLPFLSSLIVSARKLLIVLHWIIWQKNFDIPGDLLCCKLLKKRKPQCPAKQHSSQMAVKCLKEKQRNQYCIPQLNYHKTKCGSDSVSGMSP